MLALDEASASVDEATDTSIAHALQSYLGRGNAASRRWGDLAGLLGNSRSARDGAPPPVAVTDSTKAHRCVLIIAHRVSTIMACDQVMVLGSGRLLESGVPAMLATREGGEFHAMAQAAANANAADVGGVLVPAGPTSGQ